MKKILMVLTLLSVLVCCGAASASDPTEVTNIEITPQNPEIKVGESVTLTAQGYDNNGNPVQIQDPNWEWDPNYGTLTVDSTNPCKATFQATAEGTGYALCYEGPPSQQIAYGSTDITIQGGGAYLARIDVTPNDVSLQVDDTTQFTATGYDQNGNVYQIDPVWSTSGGTIDQDGKYTATVPGDFSVTASVSGSTVTGTGSIQVQTEPYLAKIDVTPNDVSLQVDETTQFTATGYDQYGNVYQIDPVWSTSGGTIDQNGNYVATVPGNFEVTVLQYGSTVTGKSSVKVEEAPYLAKIVVSPNGVGLYPGQQLQFTCTGYDQYGDVMPVTPVWTVNVGTITKDGLYTAAQGISMYYVIAQYSSFFDTASGDVYAYNGPPYLVRIEISPSSTILHRGERIYFTATGYDQYGNIMPINPVWSICDGFKNIPWGYISQGGLYTAPDVYFTNALGSQMIYVMASAFGVSDKALVIVDNPLVNNDQPTTTVGQSTGTTNSNSNNEGTSTTNTQNGATTTNTNTSPNTSNDRSPLIYLGGALVAVLVALGIYKLR